MRLQPRPSSSTMHDKRKKNFVTISVARPMQLRAKRPIRFGNDSGKRAPSLRVPTKHSISPSGLARRQTSEFSQFSAVRPEKPQPSPHLHELHKHSFRGGMPTELGENQDAKGTTKPNLPYL